MTELALHFPTIFKNSVQGNLINHFLRLNFKVNN